MHFESGCAQWGWRQTTVQETHAFCLSSTSLFNRFDWDFAAFKSIVSGASLSEEDDIDGGWVQVLFNYGREFIIAVIYGRTTDSHRTQFIQFKN